MQLSEQFRQTVTDVFEDGAHWLAALPPLLAEFERRWSVTVGAPFGLSYNFAAAARHSDGRELVIKAGVPRGELRREIAALRVYDGRGIARLVDADVACGVMLLERLQPGSMLSELEHPDEAVTIAGEVMRNLWRPLPHSHEFRSVREWVAGFGRLRGMFDGGTGPLPEWLVDSAENIFSDLFSSADEPVLLHGDLHHFNILSAGRAPWLAIDPKGMYGEPAFETGTFIRNHLDIYGDRHEPALLAKRCIAILSEQLGIDGQRIRQHAIAQAVLSAWWSFEDSGRGWEPACHIAEILSG